MGIQGADRAVAKEIVTDKSDPLEKDRESMFGGLMYIPAFSRLFGCDSPLFPTGEVSFLQVELIISIIACFEYCFNNFMCIILENGKT